MIMADGKCKECGRECIVTLYDLGENGYAWLCDKCAHGERL